MIVGGAGKPGGRKVGKFGGNATGMLPTGAGPTLRGGTEVVSGPSKLLVAAVGTRRVSI